MTAEQEKLVVDNMYIVPYIVDKYFHYQIYFEKGDLCSIGYWAMCKAARDFDPERGWKYVTLAGKYVRSAILNEIQKATRGRRDVRNCTTTFDRPIDLEKSEDTLGSLIPAVDDVETVMDAKLLIEWLDKKHGKVAKIVRLYVAGYSQPEIASEIGHSQSSVSRQLSAAKDIIRRYYNMAI